MHQCTYQFLLAILSCLVLNACAHEGEAAATVMPAHYALQSQKGAEAVTTPGFVSRYQRQTIIANRAGNPSSPCAENFGEIMDHLETLMAPQIEQNNRIAASQAADYLYRF